MKVANDATLSYGHAAWSTTELLNADGQADPTKKENAKYKAFNNMKVAYLRLDNMDRGTNSVLQPASANDRGSDTLFELMQRTSTTKLNLVSGQSTPGQLATGALVSTCGNPWSINGKGGSAFWQRIGGTFTSQWSCGYGSDSNGADTGAESAGFGLRDSTWGPFVHASKGFGTRQAHDYDNSAGGGQVYANGAIWVA